MTISYKKPQLEDLKQLIGQEIRDDRSPAGKWLGLTLDAIEPGYAELSLTVRTEHCNTFGNIHGGIMALVIDESIGYAIISMELDTMYTSVNLNVNYLYATPLGETLVTKAKIMRQGKKIINAEIHVYNKNTNVLLATCQSNLVATNMKMK